MSAKRPTTTLAINQVLETTVEGIGSFGEGLSHFEGAEIFTPKTAPQEKVELKIIEKKKGRYRAELLNIMEPSPLRVAPPCRHFELCGGCDFQHLPYEEQLAWKLRMTKHWIRRSPLAKFLDKIEFDEIASPSPLRYRHRVRLQVKNKKLHFYKPHSNEIFEIQECPVLVPGFFESLKQKASTLPDTRDWNQSFQSEPLVNGENFYELEGERIYYNSECFTQGNLEVNELMWERVREEIETLESQNSALDLYSGIGNFSLPLSRHFVKVTGVESHPVSVAFARKNSSKIRWISGLVEEELLALEKSREFFDFVLLDPPRAGALQTARILARMMPPRILSISCNLETLIPDLVALTKNGYKITRWTVVDMFPQTHHIESIVSLKR